MAAERLDVGAVLIGELLGLAEPHGVDRVRQRLANCRVLLAWYPKTRLGLVELALDEAVIRELRDQEPPRADKQARRGIGDDEGVKLRLGVGIDVSVGDGPQIADRLQQTGARGEVPGKPRVHPSILIGREVAAFGRAVDIGKLDLGLFDSDDGRPQGSDRPHAGPNSVVGIHNAQDTTVQ